MWLKVYNLVMVAKKAWKLISNSNALIIRLLKAIYFSKVIILVQELVTIQVMFGVKFGVNDVLHRGFKWSIRLGESISVWHQPWLSEGDNIIPVSQLDLVCPNIIVS